MGLYYRDNFDVDYRAIRYVGIMSPEEQAFHGTTDYSSGKEIFVYIYKFRYDLESSEWGVKILSLFRKRTKVVYDVY